MQVFVVNGYDAEGLGHSYAFADIDEAMEFEGYVSELTEGEDIEWEIVTHTVYTARSTFDLFKKMEGYK